MLSKFELDIIKFWKKSLRFRVRIFRYKSKINKIKRLTYQNRRNIGWKYMNVDLKRTRINEIENEVIDHKISKRNIYNKLIDLEAKIRQK